MFPSSFKGLDLGLRLSVFDRHLPRVLAGWRLDSPLALVFAVAIAGAAALTLALAWLAMLSRFAGSLDDSPWHGLGLAWVALSPVVLGVALISAWRLLARRRLERTVERLRTAAERLAAGDTDVVQRARALDAELDALVAPFDRLGLLQQATSAVLVDRDAQLSALRSLGGAIYFETDPQGHYTRVELPPQSRRPELAGLVGHARWDGGAALADGRDWEAHRHDLERRQPFLDLPVRRIGRDGEEWFATESATPRLAADGSLLGWCGVMRETTADEQLRRERSVALAALQASTEATVLLRADGDQGWRVAWANRSACRLFDRAESELLAIREPALLGTANRMLSERIDHALRAGRGLKLSLSLPDRYGADRQVRLCLDPLAAGGTRSPIAVLTLDPVGPELETLRQQASTAERLRNDVAARALELEALGKELESFSYTVSHDLRAPLRVVEGFAKIVQEDYGHQLDRMANEHMNRILAAAGRMNSMIDALLSMSRLSSRPIVPEKVDLSRLASAVVDELRAGSPGREVGVTVEPGLQVRGDTTLLRAVLQNLLGNAWKYTARQPRADIGLTAEHEAGRTIYCVWDNGVGFDMRFADRLFKPFQRLHSASDFPGTGVGLASVQRIVRRHGGRIWAESEPGTGSRFYFTLWDPAPSDPD